MGSHRDGGWEDSCHQNAVQGAPGTRVWPASCWAVCLHLDIPRAPEGPPAPLPAPAATCTRPGLLVPPLGPFYKQMPQKASKVGQRRGS